LFQPPSLRVNTTGHEILISLGFLPPLILYSVADGVLPYALLAMAVVHLLRMIECHEFEHPVVSLYVLWLFLLIE
jgi:hypothetical protein